MRIPFTRRDPGTARALADRLIADRRKAAFLKDMKTRIRWAWKASGWAIGATMLYMGAWWMFQPSQDDVQEQASSALLAMIGTYSETRTMPRDAIEGPTIVALASARFNERNHSGHYVAFSYEDGNLIARDLEDGACDLLIEEYPQIDAEGPEGPSNLSCADGVLALAIGKPST